MCDVTQKADPLPTCHTSSQFAHPTPPINCVTYYVNDPLSPLTFPLYYIYTRKNFVLQELSNTPETEDMRKIRYILPNFTVNIITEMCS